MIIFTLLMVSTVAASNETDIQDTTVTAENSNIDETIIEDTTINKISTENTKEANTTTAKKDCKLTINNINTAKYDENITVTGKFINTNNVGLKSNNVLVTINGNKKTVSTDDNGVYSTSFLAREVGKNNITISYLGSSKYNPTSTSLSFNIIKKDTKLTITTVKNAKYDDNITITGKFTNADNKILINSKIKITINGKEQTITTDENGNYKTSYTTRQIGTNNITVSYPGNTKYNPTSTSTTFNVIKKDTKLTITTVKNAKYDDNITITGKFTNADNKILINSKIKITINGKEQTITTDENGNYKTSYTTRQIGTNNITVSYPGNTKYNPTSTSTTFTVAKKDLIINIDKIANSEKNEKITITGNFKNADGKTMVSNNLLIKVNGNTRTIKTDNNGIFKFDYTTQSYGTNNVTVYYEGNGNYNPTSTSTTFNVIEKEDPDVRLSGYEIHPGESRSFLALLPYEATGTATYKINNNVIATLDVEYGMALYSYKVPTTFNEKTYTLYLIYSGDENYKAKTVSSTLTLTPKGGRINSTMYLNNITTKYLATTPITLNLEEDAFGTVLFQINDTNISDEIEIKNGRATFNYKVNLLPGTYNLTAIYDGNYKYLQTITNATLTINKLDTKFIANNYSSKAGANTNFSAILKDELGNPVADNKVVFKINSITMGTGRTDSEGRVSIMYVLPSSLYDKTYNITIKSTENNKVYSANQNMTLTLLQLNTKVSVPTISAIPSKSISLTATVVDEFNHYVTKGYVIFSMNNKTLKKVPVENGFAKFVYESDYETANTTLTAKYYGDWKYGNSTGSGIYQISMVRTILTCSVSDAKPNSETTIRATIRDQNQNLATEGTVRFTLNNTIIGTATVKNGIASITYKLNSCPAGVYKVTCEYYDSKIYKESANNNTLTVNRYVTSLKGSAVYGVVGTSIPITLTVNDEEKYKVNQGTVKYYINNKLIGSAKVSDGTVTLNYAVPSEYDGKTVKYYAVYEKNDLYESCSYSDTFSGTHQQVVYVSPSGSDSNLGDEKHPFKTIQYAVDHITLFGTIHLTAGTFSASGINIDNSISIIGAGRDSTIITAQNTGKPVFNISKRNVVLNLNGVTIKNGKSNSNFSAGAIFSSGKLNIVNSRFINNTGNGAYSGGAIYSNGILNVTNTEFTNNVVTNINSQGGAIRTYDNDTYITNCKFDSNKVTGTNSTGGSVLYCDGGNTIIDKSTFTKNSVTGRYVTGGVIRTIYGAVVITNSTFNSNTIKATDYGMGGVVGSIMSGVSIINSTLSSNTIEATDSAGAAAIYIETAALDVKNSKINSNKLISKTSYGGAIYNYQGLVTLIEDEFNSNSINGTEGYGGAIYSYGGNITMDKTNFTSNTIKTKTAALAGAAYVYSYTKITNSNFEKNYVNATNIGGGAIANMGDLQVAHTNFISNNGQGCGNSITATNTSVNNIENNYWESTSPDWSKQLFGVTKPSTFSTTKFNN